MKISNNREFTDARVIDVTNDADEIVHRIVIEQVTVAGQAAESVESYSNDFVLALLADDFTKQCTFNSAVIRAADEALDSNVEYVERSMHELRLTDDIIAA